MKVSQTVQDWDWRELCTAGEQEEEEEEEEAAALSSVAGTHKAPGAQPEPRAQTGKLCSELVHGV